MALAKTLKLRGRNREVESSLPCLAAAAPGNGILMAANSKKVINFLSAGLRPPPPQQLLRNPPWWHQKHAKHGRFRTFRAAPRGLRLRHATKHLKRYNYDFNHLCLRFLLAPNGHLPTEYFWYFWAFCGIFALNDLFALGRGRCGGLRFLFLRAQKLPTPRAGAGALKVKPPDSRGRAFC